VSATEGSTRVSRLIENSRGGSSVIRATNARLGRADFPRYGAIIRAPGRTNWNPSMVRTGPCMVPSFSRTILNEGGAGSSLPMRGGGFVSERIAASSVGCQSLGTNRAACLVALDTGSTTRASPTSYITRNDAQSLGGPPSRGRRCHGIALDYS